MPLNRIPIIDFPKLKSPFVREMRKGRYVVTPDIEEGYDWVFKDPSVRAVDKLHGSNVCVHIRDGVVVAIDNRKTRVLDVPSLYANMHKGKARMLAAVINSFEKGWMPSEDGSIFGEFVAPEINGNLHHVDRPYFVPFDYLYEKCHWHSWVRGDYPKTMATISEWFKGLESLFTKTRMKKEGFAEGLVFTHPDGRRAKLRRSMFEWYTGNEKH